MFTFAHIEFEHPVEFQYLWCLPMVDQKPENLGMHTYIELKIKHWRLGSRIRDMESYIGEHSDYFSFLLVSRSCPRHNPKHFEQISRNAVNSKIQLPCLLLITRPVYFYLFGRNRTGIVQIVLGKVRKFRATQS